MEAISFILSGKTAHLKKPDVNSYAYFTYNNIHKPAILGLLGAILGLGGYTQLFDKIERLKNQISKSKGKEKKPLQEKLKIYENEYPEFYEKLKDLKISIKPLSKNGYFNKKIQVFNNSVGYASKEQGGNLIVREQWLENPKWQIILLDDNSIEKELFDRLKDYLLNSKTEFIPYLGKNDHPAKIEEVKIITLNKVKGDFSGKILSIFANDNFVLNPFSSRGERPFFHKEFLPVSLKEKYHIYELMPFIYTTSKANSKDNLNMIFSYDKGNYFFF